MYTICFETFNNRLPDFASPTWIEIIDYLSFLPESKRYLGGTVSCIGPAQQRHQGSNEWNLIVEKPLVMS